MIRARRLVRSVPWLESLYQSVRARWALDMPREFVIARFRGDRPWSLVSDESLPAPILTAAHVGDVPAEYVADPFLLVRRDAWQLFFEVLRADTGRGVIAHATSRDGRVWHYGGVVLAEPFHLSYPFVFEFEDEVYMIPESFGTRSVRLYRAIDYPHRWLHVEDLLQGEDCADSTVFRHAGAWWMFTTTRSRFEGDEPVGAFDALRLYRSATLVGPWKEHPQSPVIWRDPRVARMAGRVLEHDGRLVRFAQDCSTVYGRQVYAFEVTQLTPDRYEEQQLTDGPVLGPGRVGWNAGGMHHVDAVPVAGEWFGVVDGWRLRPAMRLRRRLGRALRALGGRGR